MAAGNLGLGVAWVPSWLKHTPDIGYGIADLVAPLFIVISAFTLGPAVRRRRDAVGLGGALSWLAGRGLALVGIGGVISAGEWIFLPAPRGTNPTWGVLQAIGVATLITGSVILLSPVTRLAVGTGILLGYELLLNAYWLDTVRRSAHNGLLGSVAWGGLMVLATAVADRWRAAPTPTHRRRILVVAGLVCAGIGPLLSPVFPIAKDRASATYMLLSLGLSLLLLAIAEAAFAPRPRALMWLQRVGRRPLAMYLAHLILLAPLTLVVSNALYVDASPPVTLLEVAVLDTALVALAAVLDRRPGRRAIPSRLG